MLKKLLIFILLAMPLGCMAKFELSLAGGTNWHEGPLGKGYISRDPSLGWSSTIRGIIRLRSFETGFGFEFGSFPYIAGDGFKGSGHYQWPKGYDPYFSPHIFINKLFNLKKATLYAGGMIGSINCTQRSGSIQVTNVNITSKNNTLPDASGMTIGLQGGIDIKLCKRLSFNGEIAARGSTLRIKAHSRGLHNSYHMLYYPATVGIRYTL